MKADTNTLASVLGAEAVEGRDRADGGENVTESAKSKNDVALETSIPGASLESILCTKELQRRPSRPPDYEKENRALVALASALADLPRTILQTLAETVLEVLQADSAGLSLLTKDEKRFYWAAIAGAWQRYIGGGTPRDFGPCGDVLDHNVPMLFTHWERRYPYLRPATPLAEEGLLIPFYVNGKAVGTIWAIAHDDHRKFDAEDLRLLESLGRFASAAYQTVASIDDLKFQIAAREKAETELRQLTDGLERQVRVRTRELEQRNTQLAEAKALLAEEKLALELSEAYLAEAQRLSHTGSWRWNVGTGEVVWSQEFFALFGFDPHKTKPSYSLGLERIHPEDRTRVEQVQRAAVREKRDFEIEYRLLLPGGLMKYVHSIGQCLVSQSGDTEYIGAVMDITDSKQAEEALHRSEKELRDLIETIPAMAFVARPDGSNEFVSRPWIEYSGLSAQQTAGSGWETTLHPDDVEQHVAKWRASWTTGQPFENEARHRDAHGNYRWFLVRAVPLRDGHGQIVKWYGTLTDIEDRKRAEEAVRASEQLARGQVEALVQNLDALATAPAPDQFILRMLGTMGRLLGSEWIAVWLWLVDGATDSLVLRAVVSQDSNSDLDASEHPFVKDPLFWKEDSGLQELFFTGVPIPYEDVETDPRIPAALRAYARSQGTHKILRLPTLVGGKVKGFITICHAQRPPYQPAEIELAQALAHQAMLAIQSGQAATLEERNRMTRDIHDTLAQGLMAIVVHLQAADDASAKGLKKDAQKHLQVARDLARQSLIEARRSVHALRPLALESTSFWEALKGMIKQSTVGTALHTRFQMRGHPRELSPLWQENLLHIGQEALTNALKYAHARRFEVRLNFNKYELRLELEDDGEGFRMTDRHNGYGLIGMGERVEQMGGRLTVTSSRGKGTKVTVAARYVS
jgi:PAS domain S-box-containing protein